METKKTRNTEKQNLVKEILSKTKHTMSAEDIMNAMPLKVNKTTIYRILDRFAEKGEVHFVTGKNGKAYYALCNNCEGSHEIHNHIHFECQICKEVTCQPYTLSMPDLDGFTIQETQFLVIGICNKCKK
ncbi:Fur family transcriptional regulator [Aquimarina algicola]|uniref:Fur family transcriptional regulator n=1 Tax=Aquimarina algicola TaxID=2589995 RepID=A0A504J9I0_9FLAO|nr:transcriptional repressor [Aquimarina algicola]TPN82841.1 Fur family transcriptional regulator [Aquimarina algicola]